jgi:two-component system, LytTR family, sensor kinase
MTTDMVRAPEPPEIRLSLRTVAIVLGLWCVDALLYLQQQVLYRLATGDEAPLQNAYYLGFKTPAIWAAFTLILIAVRLIPRLRDRRLPVIIGVHFAVAMVLHVVDVIIDIVAGQISGVVPIGVSFAANVSRQSTGNIFLYMVTAAGLHILDFNRISKMRAVDAARLQGQLSEARLEMLKMQLQPHFLFNTLHAMAALVQDDPRAAERMILRLGDLLRAAMDMTGRSVIPLADEINLLRAYLDIQQIRFRDRLNVRIDVPRELERAAVPNLILQPLVENAIKHGAAKQIGPTSIHVAVRRSNGELALQVVNSGGPNGRVPALVEGMGMRNTRARLAELYPGKYGFGVEIRPEGGAVATIRIPHTDSDEDLSPIPDSS